MTKNRSFAAIAAAAGVGLALLAASGAAQARDVFWSIGVNSPGVSVGVGAGPGVIYSPPVTYVAPPARVLLAPGARVLRPAARGLRAATAPGVLRAAPSGGVWRVRLLQPAPHWHRGGYWR